MHDPMSLAFSIRYPWRSHKKWPRGCKRWEDIPKSKRANRSQFWPKGYRDEFIQIWHVDPEKDGTDNSCGWCWPKLTKAQAEKIKNLAWHEAREPWFMRAKCKSLNRPTEVESLAIAAFELVDRVLKLRVKQSVLHRLARASVHTPGDNGRSQYCFLAGYHSNNGGQDDEYWRTECATGLFSGIARELLRHKRPWWKHPRWHIHHWKINCIPVLHFKRWAFSRCQNCGGRFKWGESPCSGWNAAGPKWFKSEQAWHMNCDPTKKPCENKETVPA